MKSRVKTVTAGGGTFESRMLEWVYISGITSQNLVSNLVNPGRNKLEWVSMETIAFELRQLSNPGDRLLTIHAISRMMKYMRELGNYPSQYGNWVELDEYHKFIQVKYACRPYQLYYSSWGKSSSSYAFNRLFVGNLESRESIRIRSIDEYDLMNPLQAKLLQGSA